MIEYHVHSWWEAGPNAMWPTPRELESLGDRLSGEAKRSGALLAVQCEVEGTDWEDALDRGRDKILQAFQDCGIDMNGWVLESIVPGPADLSNGKGSSRFTRIVRSMLALTLAV
jgi:hypothetical protein